MAPFEPDVEAALLQLLRRQAVWPCFDGTKKRIGRRGFNTLGYWEAKKQKGSASGSEDGQEIHPRTELTLTTTKNSVKPKSVVPFFNSHLYGSFNQALVPSLKKGGLSCTKCSSEVTYDGTRMAKMNAILFEGKVVPLCRIKAKQSRKRKQLTREDILCMKNAMKLVLKGKDDPFKESLELILSLTPTEAIPMGVVSLYHQFNFSIFYGKRLPLDKCLDEKTEIFFTRGFCIPNLDQRKFIKDKTIGTVLADLRSHSIVDEDDYTRSLYRGSITGMVSLALRVNPLQGISYLKEGMETFLRTGQVWWRSLEHRCDGTVMVLLNRYTMSENFPGCSHVECQDVTEQYVNYL